MTALTMINAMIVEASASRPASATDGWRIRTRSAKNCTMMWTTQNSSVASSSAVASIENLLNTAEQISSAAAIPTSDAPSLIPQRLSTIRA
jgi:hypothetical protein